MHKSHPAVLYKKTSVQAVGFEKLALNWLRDQELG